MKIKTGTGTKTAPIDQPPIVEGSTPAVVSPCRRRCRRRPPMTTCDRVLVGLLIFGVIAGVATFVGLKISGHREHDGGRHHRHHGHHGSSSEESHESDSSSEESGYKSGLCTVREITTQPDICCPYKRSTGCAEGQRGSLRDKSWYKFQDEAEMQKPNMIEHDDMAEEDRNDKFPCYQVILEYQEVESEGAGATQPLPPPPRDPVRTHLQHQP